MNRVPLVDLRAQYHSIKREVDAAVSGVLESGQFVLGGEVASFESEFASYCQSEYAVGVNSGTSALHLALLAAGIGPGDEVITVPFTFVATVAAILYTGARPVFVDIDPHSYTMDVGQVEATMSPHTKALLPVHLYGRPADMDPILDVAGRHHVVVIEDAAQAHGAEYKGHRVGSIGHMGCFSFYPGKNLGAYGEGGAVTTSNPEYARTVRMLRDWGAERKYYHQLKGYNYRMEEFQAAILRVKLRHIDRWTTARRSHARHYSALLERIDVPTPVSPEYCRHVYHVYAIRLPHRDETQSILDARGIQTGIHYPTPVHLLPGYADLGYKEGQFPQSERAATEVLSLPMFPELRQSQIEWVASSIAAANDQKAP